MNLSLNTTEWLLVAVVVIDALMLVAIILMILHRSPPVAGSSDGTHPILERLANEPALLSGFIAAAAALTTSFGFELTAEQTGAIMALVVAGLAIFVRQQVTPVRTLPATTRRRMSS